MIRLRNHSHELWTETNRWNNPDRVSSFASRGDSLANQPSGGVSNHPVNRTESQSALIYVVDDDDAISRLLVTVLSAE